MAGNAYTFIVYNWRYISVEHIEVARSSTQKGIFFNANQTRRKHHYLEFAILKGSNGDGGYPPGKLHFAIRKLVFNERLLPNCGQVFGQKGMFKLFASHKGASTYGG